MRGTVRTTSIAGWRVSLLGLLCVLPLLAAMAIPAPPPAMSAPITTMRLDQRYLLTATYHTDSGRLDVAERIRLTNRASRAINAVNLSVIPRALGNFRMPYRAKVDGQPATQRWTTTSNLRVRLGRNLEPGERVTIRLRFQLRPSVQSGAFSARLAREAGVASFGEWFPIVSREHDSYGVGDPQVSRRAKVIRLDLTTTAPLPRNAVACPGRIRAPEVRGWHWSCRIGDVRDFAFAVNPDYHRVGRRVAGTWIRVYAETVSGTATLDKAASAFRRLTALYGPYPYHDLVLAEVGAAGGFSMEYPRQIHLTRGKVADTYVIDHEVAHQWFYGLLGNDQMREPWLDEGFADFSARYLMGVGANQCSSKDIDVAVFAFPAGLTSGGNWSGCEGYFFSVFNRSTEMLNRVRVAMGSPDFFAALRAYIADHRYGMATTRSLLDHLQAWNGADLLPIFQAYTRRY